MKKAVIFFLCLCFCLGLYAEDVYDDMGFLKEKTENTAEGVVKSILTYKEGKLLYTSKFLNNEGEPFEIEYYLRSPVNNSLVGVKRFSGTNLVGGNYLYSEETLYLNATDNLVFSTDFEISDDGTIVITNADGETETYSSAGFLLKKESEETLIEYFYSDSGRLLERTETKENKVIETEYDENQVKYRETITVNNITDSVTVYKSTGKIQTVYENGKPFADVLYYPDNRRVREITYL